MNMDGWVDGLHCTDHSYDVMLPEFSQTVLSLCFFAKPFKIMGLESAIFCVKNNFFFFTRDLKKLSEQTLVRSKIHTHTHAES